MRKAETRNTKQAVQYEGCGNQCRLHRLRCPCRPESSWFEVYRRRKEHHRHSQQEQENKGGR